MEPDDEDAEVKGAFVAVYAEDGDRAFGAGVLIDDDVIVTCAHVVNAALGLDERAAFEVGTPTPGLRVAFPYWGKATYRVEVLHHVPRTDSGSAAPLRFGAEMWSGDIAVLRVMDPPVSARPVRVGPLRLGEDAVAWYASGDARGVIEARFLSWANSRMVLNAGWHGATFTKGYSGGPLWDRRRRTVVGIVVSAAGTYGCAIAEHELAGELTGVVELRHEAVMDPAQVVVLLEPLREALGAAMPLLSDPDQISRRVLTQLNLSMARDRPGWDDLVHRIAQVRRGPAVLAAEVAASIPDVNLRRKLARAAVDASLGRMLGSDEYRRLCGLLEGVTAERLASVSLRALPRIHSMPPVSEGRHRILDFLERRRFAEGRVPPLLRVAEFLAASVKDPHQRHALRAWSQGVAWRLGVSEESLAEHRSEAEEWAGNNGRVRIQVALRSAGESLYTHQVWMHDGADAQSVCVDDVPKNADHVIACLDEVLWSWTEDAGEPVLVEFFVGLDELDLAVDQWAAPGIVDRIFGVEYEVVLRCVEPRARSTESWRRRWQRMGSSDALVLAGDEAEGTALYHFLNDSQRDVACAIITADRALRREVLRHCLCAGIPAIVWSREDSQSAAVLGLWHRDLHPSLPVALRRLRTEAAAGRQPGGEHLALIWDDPDHVPRQLRLSPPTRTGAEHERTRR